MKRISYFVPILTLIVALPGISAQAANRTWNGGGANNNWTNAANWGGTAPVANDLLFFDGSARLTNTNNIAAGTAFNGITFNSTAGVFTLGGNTINLAGGVTNSCPANAENISLSLALTATRTFDVVSGGTLSIGGVISGAGFGVTKVDAGTLTLTGNNTYSGGTTIIGGTVSVTNVAATGNQNLGSGGITFAGGGTLLNTGTGAQSTARTITLNSGGGVISMSGNTMTLTGTVSGGGGLTTGGSDLILQPSSGNNSIGTMIVASGRLFVFNTGAINGSSVLVSNGGTIDFGSAASSSPANSMTFASGACLANRLAGTLTVSTASVTFPTAGTMIFNNDDQPTTNITVNGTYPTLTGDLTIQVGGGGGAPGNVTLSGAIGGGFGLLKTLNGTLILSGANTFAGDTAVSAGTLRLGAANVIPDGGGKGNVTVNGTLDLGGFSDTVNGLSGSGTVDNTVGTGTSTLTVGNNDQTSTFSGTITDTSGRVALTKIGAGILALSGGNNFSGVATVLAGTLDVQKDGGLGGTTNVNVGTGATLELELGTANNYLNNSASLSLTNTAVVNLAFAGSDTISNLVVDSVRRVSGTWGATGSGATHIDDTHFQGTGVLNVSSGPISGTALTTSGNPTNYGQLVTFTATVTGTNGTPPLTGTVTFKDGATAIGAGTLSGSPVATATFSTNSLPAGSHTLSAVYGGDNNFAGSTSGNLTQTITKGALTVTGITAADKVYDRSTNATLDVSGATLVGVAGTDVVTLNTDSAVGAFTNNTAGTGKTVKITGLTISGADATNYSLTQPAASASITAAPVTVTSGLTSSNKVYNGTTTTTIRSNIVALAGVISPDVATLRTNGYSANFADKNVGTNKTVTITGMMLVGAQAANYALTPPTNSANISVTNITVTAATNIKAYDGTTNATTPPTISANGIQTGDTNSFAEAYANENVGTNNKVLVPFGSVGDGNGGVNYNVTFVNTNNGTITTMALTVTGITAADKVYDRSTNATLDVSVATLVGVVVADVVTLNTGSAVGAFTNNTAGTGKTVRIMGLTISGADATNYSLTQPAANASITAAPVTVTSGLTSSNKVYNGTTTTTIRSNIVALAGVISPDVATLRTNGYSANFADKNVGTNKTVTITGMMLVGAQATNYALTPPTNSANISAAPLTVSASAQSKPYGATLTLGAGLTNFTSAGLQNGETIGSVTLSASGGTNATDAVGSYTITPSAATGGTFADTNYAITYNNGTLTVLPGAIDHYAVAAGSGPLAGVPFTVTVMALDVGNNIVTNNSSTLVTMSGTGSVQFDANNDGAFGDAAKPCTNGVFTVSTLDDIAETIDITASDGTNSGTLTGLVINTAIGAYRSVGSGNWGTASIWQTNNGASWVAANASPTSANASVVTVQSGNNVTNAASVTVDQVLVQSGATLTVNSGQTLTIAAAAGPDLDISGTVNVIGTLTINGSAGVFVESGGILVNSGAVNTTGTLTFNSGGRYRHAQDGGTIPTATWSSNSTCEVTGTIATFPAGFGQRFGNLTLNNTNQTVAGSSFDSVLTVSGVFALQSTGPGRQEIRLASGVNGVGSFSQSGGTLRLSSGTARSLIVTNNFSLSGGTFEITTGSGTGTLNVGGDFSDTAGTLSAATGIGAITFNGSSVQNYTSGGTVSGVVNYTVSSGATLMTGTSLVGNGSTGTFTNASGATLGIGDASGITTSAASGNIRVTGARSFSSGANYTYNGTAAQVTGNALTNVTNLTIANAAGVKLTTNVIVSGACTIQTNALLLGTNNLNGLVIVNGAIAPGASVGRLTTRRETWNSGGSYTWEISNATGTPGAGWDLLSLTNGQGINLQATGVNPFTLKLVTLNGAVPGLAANFVNTNAYAWNIAITTNATVTNFSAGAFVIDATQFSNDLNGGTFSVVQSGAGNTNLSLSFTPAVRFLAFAQPPVNVTAGVTISPAVTVQLEDAASNNLALSGVSISLALSGGGLLGGTTNRTTDATGLATFNDLSVTQAGTNKTLSASAAGFTGATNRFNVSAGAFTKLQLLVPGESAAPGTASGKTGAPSVQNSNVAFSVTVNSVDANWNVVNTNDTIHITSSDVNAVLPSDAALFAGSADLSVALRTVGNNLTITASDVTSPGIQANTSPSITVTNPSVTFATNSFTFNYTNRAALLTNGWSFIARNRDGTPRNTEITNTSVGAVVSYDQTAHPGVLRIPCDVGVLWSTPVTVPNAVQADGGGGPLSNASRNSLFRGMPTNWVSLRLQMSFAPAQNYQGSDLVLYQDDDNYVEMTYSYNITTKVLMNHEFYGFAAQVNASNVASTNMFLRMDRDVGTGDVTGFYSLDGTNWVLVGRQQLGPVFTNLQLGIVPGGSPTTNDLPNCDLRQVQIITTAPYAPLPSLLFMQPRHLVFNSVQGQPSIVTQRVNVVIRPNSDPVNWTVAGNAAWLSTTVASGQTPGFCDVSVNTAGLTPGIYQGALQFGASDVANSPTNVSVTLIVNPNTRAGVATWRGGKKGAMSLSIDDSNPSGFEELSTNGLRGSYMMWHLSAPSFYTDYYAAGMELGSHTVNHAGFDLNEPALRYELATNIAGLVASTPASAAEIISFAWPYGYCPVQEQAVAADYFLSARGIGQNQPEDPTPNDLMNLKAYNSHEYPPYPPADFKTVVDLAEAQGKWGNLVLHTLNNDDGAIAYAVTKDVWVAPLGSVVKYIVQRDRTVITNYQETTNVIQFDCYRLPLDPSGLRSFETAITTNDTLTLSVGGAGISQVSSVFVNGVGTAFTNNGSALYFDAQVTTNVQTVALSLQPNTAPGLPAQTDRTINELTTLTVTNRATDSDLPVQTLTYMLAVTNTFDNSVQTNAHIDASGVISWIPSEAQGPGTYTLTTVVRDNGYPQLSDTNSFTVTVNEVNVAPVLPAQADRTMNGLESLTVANTASDSDLPVNPLGYTLTVANLRDNSVVANATIDGNGIIHWTPAAAQALSTNLFTTVVTDTNMLAVNSQNLSATNTFTVVVLTNVLQLPTQTNLAIDELTALAVTNTAMDLYANPSAVNGIVTNTISFNYTNRTALLADGWSFTAITNGGPRDTEVADTNFGAVISYDQAAHSGVLRIPCDTGGLWSSDNDSRNSLFRNLPTNWVSMQVELTFLPLLDFQGVTLVLYQDDDNYVDMTFNYNSFSGGEIVGLISEVDQNPVPVNATNVSGSNMVLRLDRDISTGLISGFYSADGTNWDIVAQQAGGSLTNTQLGIVLGGSPNTFPLNNLPNCDLSTVDIVTTNSSDTPVVTLTYTLAVTNTLDNSVVTNATIDSNGVISWTPTEAQGPGTYTFTTAVNDGTFTAINSFDVTVNEVNTSPTLTLPANTNIMALAAWSAQALAADADLPTNALTFALVSGPVGLTVTTDGLISWTPDQTEGASTNEVTIRVTDTNPPAVNATSLSVTDSFQIVVGPVLVVIADNTNRVYGAANPEFTGSLVGVLGGDDITATFTNASTVDAASPVGTYAIVPVLHDPGGKLANYAVLSIDGTLTVLPAGLTITAHNTNKVYGGTVTFAGTEFTATGLLNSDSATNVTLTSGGTVASAGVGSYAVAPSAAQGDGLTNYTIGYSNGTLTVTAADLLVTASDSNKVYGASLTLDGRAFTLAGTLLNGDMLTNVTMTSGGTAATAGVGSYAIIPSAAEGDGLTNYTIGYSNGTLTVNAADLLVTASDSNKVYGASLTLNGTAFTVTGTLFNSDTLTNVTLTSDGTAVSATIGTYPITASAAQGNGLTNYTIGYSNGMLTVNAADLVVTAADRDKEYGASLTLDGTAFTLTGTLFNSDTLTNVTLTSAGTAASATIGTYPITPSAAQGVGLSNYTIGYSNGTLTVKPALRITAVQESGNDMEVSFTSLSSRIYRLERNDQFPGGVWTNVADNLPGSGGILSVLDPGANTLTQAVYRVSDTDVVAEPAGFCKLSLLGDSDTLVSLPFLRLESVAGLVAGVSGNQIQVKNSSAWISNQFVYAAGVQSNTYYLLIRGGAREGRYYTITNNGSDSVSVDLQGDDLGGLGVNDPVSIIPYWTLGTALPVGEAVFASPTVLNRPTEVLMPDLNGTGVNLSASRIYFYNAGIWKQIGQGSASKNDDVLLPNSYLIVRHNVATNTVWTPLGGIMTSKIAIPLAVSATNRQDNPVGLARPAAVSLDDSGLTNAFSVSPSVLNLTDELLVFDNSATNKNKSASGIYYYLSSGWRRIGTSSTTVGTNQVFAPGAGVIVRKATNSVAPVWINSPAY